MFDRHYHREHSGPSRVDVHEHRAPTEESVRLLREMEREARDRVLNVYAVNCGFHISLVEMVRSAATADHEVLAIFALNGEEVRLRVPTDVMRFAEVGRDEEGLRLLFKVVGEAIAAKLFERLKVTP